MGKGMKWLLIGVIALLISIPYMIKQERDVGMLFKVKCESLGCEVKQTRDGGFCVVKGSIIEVK